MVGEMLGGGAAEGAKGGEGEEEGDARAKEGGEGEEGENLDGTSTAFRAFTRRAPFCEGREWGRGKAI